jgi:hypothetical protein
VLALGINVLQINEKKICHVGDAESKEKKALIFAYAVHPFRNETHDL